MDITTSKSVAAIVLMAVATVAIPADWSDCASELDSLRRRASDANGAADTADSKKRAFDEAVEEYRRCRSMPAVYDLYRDGCRAKRSEAEEAQSSYRSALSDLESALSDVDSKFRSVASSCEMKTGAASAATNYLNSLPPELRQKCAVYVRFIGRLPKDQLVAACRKQYSAEDCSRCIP